MSSRWSLQKPRAGYSQAVIRLPGGRKSVGLGYLTPDEEVDALAVLNAAGPGLAELPNDEIKKWVLEPASREGMVAPGVKAAGEYTFRAFVDEFYAGERFHQKAVAASTWDKEKSHLARFLKAFGSMRMTDITGMAWARYLSGRGNLAGNSVRLEQVAFLRVLGRAADLGVLTAVPHLPSVPRANKPVRVTRPLTVDEVNGVINNAPSPMHRAMFAAGFSLGLRPGELPTLRWEDVNWERKTLLVRGTKTSKSAGVIPLTPRALMELEHWFELSKRPSSGLMFTWGGRPLSSFKKALKTAATAAGIKARIHPNILRHTFITLAALSNPPVPMAVVMAITRHADARMITEVYAKAGAMTMLAGLGNFPL